MPTLSTPPVVRLVTDTLLRPNSKEFTVPTYDFECQTCHHRFEVTQKITDPNPDKCPQCQGPVKKVFSAVGIVFKGSGFYKTDSRPSSSSSEGSSSSSGD